MTDLVVRTVPGDQLARPVITIDPAMRFGRPHIKGVSTQAIAGLVISGDGVDAAMDDYGLTRHEVLLACWHEGLQGEYQREWGGWANAVHGPLGGWEPLDVDALPDPPEIPRPTRKARRCLTSFPPSAPPTTSPGTSPPTSWSALTDIPTNQKERST